jgi:O-antigen/teichoic acid export membrane protein
MKEPSKFYSSLGLLVLLNIIIKPVWIFLIDRQVQNHVGASAYGIYFSLLNLSIVFSFFLDWGLSTFVNQQMAANEKIRDRVGDLLLTRLFFILVYIVVIGSIAWFSGISDWDILWKVSGIQVLTSLFLFLRSLITAAQWFRTDAWLSVLDKSMMIVLCGGFLYFPLQFGSISIEKFLLVQFFATTIAVLFAAVILLQKGGFLFKIKKGFIGPDMIRAALPFGLIVLLMSTHYRLDGFLIERFHANGAYEAGLYAGAYRLLDAANMIGYLVASFLLPFIARQTSLKNNIGEVVLNSRHLLMLFSIFVALTAIFLAPWIQALLYDHEDPAAIRVIQLCLPALLGYSLVQVYGTLLTGTGRVAYFCFIVFFSVVLNILLNLLLIPEHGAIGASVAALISQGSCGIATMLYASKKCGINMHARSFLMYIFIAATAGTALYLSANSEINEWWLLAGTSMLIFILSIVTGLFDTSRWTRFIKQAKTK